MVFLLILGGFFAGFIAIAKRRRQARVARPIPAAFVSPRRPSAARADTTLGLRDPARPF